MESKKYYPLQVKKITRQTSDCISVEIDVTEELKPKFNFQSGQYLNVKSNINGEEVRRSYSLSSAPSEGRWEVAIKQVKGGKFSTYANQQLKVGDTLEVMSPDGTFRLREIDGKNHVVAFAAGSGITPILSMIKTTLEDTTKEFTLFYGNRNTDSIIYKEEIEALKNKYLNRFSVHYILSKENPGSPLFFGRIDKNKCQKFLKYFINQEDVGQFLLCGPGEMIFAVKDTLCDAGIPEGNIHFELFTTADMKKGVALKKEEDLTYDKNASSKVKIRLDGLITEYNIPYGGKSILDHAVDEGADLPFSCKGGVCSTCRAKLLEGQVDMEVNYALEPEEIEAGYVLTCQSHPRSDYIEIDFDER
jgi:ring-1,2-phenylacetyl-CoA epoxidase subunit PaaE